jgi:hypothetical protein
VPGSEADKNLTIFLVTVALVQTAFLNDYEVK